MISKPHSKPGSGSSYEYVWAGYAVIRAKEPDVRLFYGFEDVYRPCSTSFYSRLNSVVGSWSDLCQPLRGCFSEKKNGRPTDPVVYFKIFLIGYLEGIIFDTDLADRVADSLMLRSFAGYEITERTPDHSSLGRVRGALSKGGHLDAVMTKVVGMCVKAGLVQADEVAADSTLLRANTSLSSLVCRALKTVPIPPCPSFSSSR